MRSIDIKRIKIEIRPILKFTFIEKNIYIKKFSYVLIYYKITRSYIIFFERVYKDLQDIEKKGWKALDINKEIALCYGVVSAIFTEFSWFNVQQLFHRNNRVRVLHKFSPRLELSTWIILVSFFRIELHPSRFFFPSLFSPFPTPSPSPPDILTVDRKQNANYGDKMGMKWPRLSSPDRPFRREHATFKTKATPFPIALSSPDSSLSFL